MGPPPTYSCLETGYPKCYTHCQDLLRHYNSKHRNIPFPIEVYRMKQEADARPKLECPYCHKLYSQNINCHIKSKHPEKLGLKGKGKSLPGRSDECRSQNQFNSSVTALEARPRETTVKLIWMAMKINR